MNSQEMLRELVESGILAADEADHVFAKLRAEDQQVSSDAIAEELLKEGKLTSYQVESIQQGSASQLVFGEYLILDELGRGGMGVVYKALHRRMQREVALKVLTDDALKRPQGFERFQREVRAAARLVHPNVVTCHDAGEDGGVEYLVMEFVEGEDLHHAVRADGPMSMDKAVDCIAQAANGLEYAHHEGVVHRDVKPSNLIRCADDTVKLLDFGLAALRSHASTGHHTELGLTESGQMMGTFDFMSPEQAEDAASADARSDIYSLGCTLYFLLTGKPPYEADTVIRKLLAHRSEPIPDIREVREDVPRSLATLLHVMLAKNQNDRPQTMSGVSEQLAAVRAELCTKPGTRTAMFEPNSGRVPVVDAGYEHVPSSRKSASQRRYILSSPIAWAVALFAGALIALTAVAFITTRDSASAESEVAEAPVSAAAASGMVKPAYYEDFDGFEEPNRRTHFTFGTADGVHFNVPTSGGWFSHSVPIEDGIVSTSFRIVEGSNGAATVSLVSPDYKQTLYLRFLDEGKLEARGDMIAGIATRNGPKIEPFRVNQLHPVGEFNRVFLVINGRQFWVYVNGALALGPVLSQKKLTPARVRLGARCAAKKTMRAEFDDLAVWPSTELSKIQLPEGMDADIPVPATKGHVPPVYANFFGKRTTRYAPGQGVENGVFFLDHDKGVNVWNKKVLEDGIVGTSFRIGPDTQGAAIVSLWCKKSTRELSFFIWDDGTMAVVGELLKGGEKNAGIDRMPVPSLRPVGEFNQLYLVLDQNQSWIYLNDELVLGPLPGVEDICPATLRFGANSLAQHPMRVEFDDLIVWPTTDIADIVQPNPKTISSDDEE